MSRPIDADALISKLITKKYNSLDGKIEYADIIYMIQRAPTLNIQTDEKKNKNEMISP